MRFLLGGYGEDMGGRAAGVGMLLAGAADAALAGGPLAFAGEAVAASGSPSWLARHPSLDVVYAALEGAGAVQAFRRTGEEAFAPLGDPVAAGELVCHIAVAPSGASLVASCWGDGRVVRMTLDAAGRPSAPVVAAAAADLLGETGEPSADIDLAAAARALREAAGSEYAHLVPAYDEPTAPAGGEDGERTSRAHHAVFISESLVATTDMGLDLVRIWQSGDGGLRAVTDAALPRGSGPRHMVWHPSGHLYVVTECSHEVFVLAPSPFGAWRVVGATPLAPGVPSSDASAELCSSRDGEFLYAGLRGSDTIATLRVRGDGGSIAPAGIVEAGTSWPRHHLVVRDTLLVAGQHSDEVVSLTLDSRTGVPGRVRHRAEAPTPTCILPAR